MKLKTKINPPKLWIDIKVQTPEGVVLQELSEEGHSWVRNFYILHSLLMTDTRSTLDYGLQNSDGFVMQDYLLCDSGHPDSGYLNEFDEYCGILVGSSNEPFHVADYNLYDQIFHGVETGQLYHQTMSRSSMYDDLDEFYTTILARAFNNDSHEEIIIREVGLYRYVGVWRWISPYLMARDVLSSSITVPHEATVNVKYTLTTYSLFEFRPTPPH